MARELAYGDVAAAAALLGALFKCDPKLDDQMPDLLASLSEMDAAELAEIWPTLEDGEARELLEGLQQYAECDHNELAKRYRRLFVGPTALAAPPYGSVYTDRDQVLFGESTLALRSWMRREGIAVDGLDGAPEDHIGTMMLLLSWIASNKPELLDDYLTNHLLTWAPHYLEQLEAAAGDGFYGALARLAEKTLIGIGEARGLQVALPHFYR